MKKLLGIFLVTLACQPTKDTKDTQSKAEEVAMLTPDHHSAAITKVFDAHGGYNAWSKMKSLKYMKGEEQTIVNLENRKIKLESPQVTIGYDGQEVWVVPDTADATSARFYHNLYFYFYAMPFVLGDPGVLYEEIPDKEIQGKSYKGIKISFGENIGDAPDDNYIVWYDPETNKMEWLMYTVTYRTGEPNDQYRLIKYHSWSDFAGLKLPTTLHWYEYENDSVGGMKGGEVLFENIEIGTEAPPEDLFQMPDSAQVAPKNNA